MSGTSVNWNAIHVTHEDADVNDYPRSLPQADGADFLILCEWCEEKPAEEGAAFCGNKCRDEAYGDRQDYHAEVLRGE